MIGSRTCKISVPDLEIPLKQQSPFGNGFLSQLFFKFSNKRPIDEITFFRFSLSLIELAVFSSLDKKSRLNQRLAFGKQKSNARACGSTTNFSQLLQNFRHYFYFVLVFFDTCNTKKDLWLAKTQMATPLLDTRCRVQTGQVIAIIRPSTKKWTFGTVEKIGDDHVLVDISSPRGLLQVMDGSKIMELRFAGIFTEDLKGKPVSETVLQNSKVYRLCSLHSGK
jgi:hypothetical protein